MCWLNRGVHKGAWRCMEARALLFSEAWLCGVGPVFVAPSLCISSESTVLSVLSRRSEQMSGLLVPCIACSTWHRSSPREQAFLQNMSACPRSEFSSSAFTLTSHPVFESVQSLTFSTLPLAPTCWDDDTSAQTYVSLPPLKSPWQAEFLTSFTMSNFSLVDLFNFLKIIFFSPNNDLEFVHQLEPPGITFLPRHWQEGDCVLYYAGADASQRKFIRRTLSCLLRLMCGQCLFLKKSHQK